jgi:hypothetical protein
MSQAIPYQGVADQLGFEGHQTLTTRQRLDQLARQGRGMLHQVAELRRVRGADAFQIQTVVGQRPRFVETHEPDASGWGRKNSASVWGTRYTTHQSIQRQLRTNNQAARMRVSASLPLNFDMMLPSSW